MEKLTIPYPILVEGKYDRLRLLEVVEPSTRIIKTDGFGIFNRGEIAALIRALAQRSRLIVLTDSDGAGKLIRSRISGLIPREKLIQLYIPQIKGKERRKAEPSREGTLGVEGMELSLLYDLLAPYADGSGERREAGNPLSKTDLYLDGLSGGENAAAKRDALCDKLSLPHGMTANALLSALRLLCTYDEYLVLVGRDTGHTENGGTEADDANA